MRQAKNDKALDSFNTTHDNVSEIVDNCSSDIQREPEVAVNGFCRNV